ncbi:sigma 54-interacting transcriptional regulator [Phycisphaerales bacterium AB-hyl4]|uniref:Sigma 54-interacting transcriptional regulator n=1 Tax=Natronomicrosphaera hydrolytica TaxID=3242702 RepID=A0ABV4U5D2_9BACT
MDRPEQELDILEEISQILGDGLELSQVFQRATAVLTERMDIQRAALVLLDRTSDQLQTIASIGLTRAEQERGRYAVGEGVTGQVLASGQPAVVADIARHPEFLNRTGARQLKGTGGNEKADAEQGEAGAVATSFICVPIRDSEEIVGTISVDKPFVSDARLQADARLLKIIAGCFAQAIRIHNLIQVEKDEWLAENRQLKDNLRSKYRFDNIIGSSPVMLDVLATVSQVATSRATVLLLGETGCGKELFAKAIHFNSPRRDKPLIRINCGALSPQLLESELFGHVKGAFTGAIKDKIGRFEAASGGTIFLDEVGTLDAQLQVKLLRVLQEREFERVGDHHTVKVDVRVIAATNLDLEEEVRKGNFREDLYYRLNVVTLNLPALRSRREDIPKLIDHFLDRYNRENNRDLRKLNRDVLNTLLRYPWPGNVRELENAVERAVVLSNGEEFTEDLLPLQIRMYAQQTRGDGGDESIEALCAKLAEQAIEQYQVHEGEVYNLLTHEVERHLIREALAFNDGVKLRTADFLGINRNTLNKKVKDLGIDTAD